MKKNLLIVIAFAIIPFTTANAVQIDSNASVHVQSQNKSKSKLQRVQEQIDKYQRIIDNYPKRLKKSEELFNRLTKLGKEVEEVLRKYVTAIDNCANNAHTNLGRDACEDFNNLDLGREIKDRKAKVVAMIDEAKRELMQVKAEGGDIVIVKRLLESLKATKKMLMQ